MPRSIIQAPLESRALGDLQTKAVLLTSVSTSKTLLGPTSVLAESCTPAHQGFSWVAPQVPPTHSAPHRALGVPSPACLGHGARLMGDPSSCWPPEPGMCVELVLAQHSSPVTKFGPSSPFSTSSTFFCLLPSCQHQNPSPSPWSRLSILPGAPILSVHLPLQPERLVQERIRLTASSGFPLPWLEVVACLLA